MTTFDKIWPVIRDTYGTSGFVRAAAHDIANFIDRGEFRGDSRETAVMLRLWHWFSGGTTAGFTAARIEDALR